VHEVEQLTDPVAEHGEGPVWHPSWVGPRFVDMLAGDVLECDPGTGAVKRSHHGEVVAALRPRRGGGMVLGVERGFALVDPDGTSHALPELWADPTVRMNEGGCDPQGRFYCGSMDYDARPGRGALYRLDGDRSVEEVLDDVTISNGLAWSPDGSTAYYVDTPTGGVDALDFDADHGRFGGRRRIVTVPAEDGTPDGITVDAEGFIWVALWSGSAVRRHRPDGRLDDVVRLPVPNVTACCFGGLALTDLFVTTSRLASDHERFPEAGALFRVRPGVAGLPTSEFQG
jgi:sugar lactone lactonase YvrE